jgi:soluble lytic murein transglycosylase
MRVRQLLATILLAVSPLGAQAPLDSVEAALRAGDAWRATRLLTPALRSADGRTPEVLIAAARAAAGWEGWTTVERLLKHQEWLDGRFDRLGRRLLAEAALADGRPGDALTQIRAALVQTVYPRTDEEQARRWIILARAHERLSAWDSAGAAYTRAAPLFPELSDWLALRAAGVTADAARRARLYTTVTNPVAHTRIEWTEALALSRMEEKEAAARVYASLGASADALRLRWEANTDPPTRGRIADELFRLVRADRPAGEVRQALEIIEGYSVPMARSESLLVATRAEAHGRPSQAAKLLTALARGGSLTNSQLMALGDAEGDLGRWSSAARTYRQIKTGPLAGRAAYYEARALLRGGNGGAAISRLRRIPSRFASDTFAAGTALYLLGDLALDANDPDSTRVLFTRLASRYPSSGFAQRAALIAPLIALARGNAAAARRELEASLGAGRLTGFDADAGRYWLGRSFLALDQPERARANFRELLARGPENYYAVLAAARLDTMPWRLPSGTVPTPDSLPPALHRARLLDAIGLDFEAGLERDGYAAAAGNPEARLAAGEAFLAAGFPNLATRLGYRALSAGAARSGALWRLLYPLPYAASLRTAAEAASLDPWLAAAVIRQESAFDPRATSAVGARGLMQVMPSVGPALARSVGIPDFDPALLWQPDVNLAMGTRHLAEALGRYDDLELALAAYNAGGTRVERWRRSPLTGARDGEIRDPELFVERIPYLETRVYIRNITVNRAVYRMLYEVDGR